MKEIFINEDNLSKNEINEEVIRVKGLIINDKNEILLGYSNNTYQFPGGHLEEGEAISDTLKREIKEETGILITKKELKPFMMIKYYIKNYCNSGKNRCNKIYYIIVNINDEPDLTKTDYTEDEIKHNYTLRRINLLKVKKIIKNNSKLYPVSEGITKEMVEVIDEYFKIV